MESTSAKLDAGRAFVAENRNAPLDDRMAEDIAYQLVASLPREAPATMKLAIAQFLANYAWNSAYTRKEAEHLLRGILKDANDVVAKAYEAEARGTAFEGANKNVQPL